MMNPSSTLINKLNIQFPIIQAPMAGGITTPELVAAVSNAGGLGSLGAGYMSASAIGEAIQNIRQLTDKPFAVNLFIPEPHHATDDQMQKACNNVEISCAELHIKINAPQKPYALSFEEQINIVIQEKIPVFSFTFGLLDPIWIEKLKKNNTIIIGSATHLKEALLLEKSGVDMIVAQGGEAGGHRGTFLGSADDSLISLENLVASLQKTIKIPIIAAGGIMDGKKIKSMLELGASAVQLGTTFLCCSESGAHPKYKEVLLSLKNDETVLTRAFSGKMARGIKNKFIARMENHRDHILDYPIQNALTNTMRQAAKEKNNIDFMSMWAGQSAQFCKELSVKELMQKLVLLG